MSPRAARFTATQRLLHWAMAVLVLAMLFIGVGMVSTVSPRYWILVSIHKPLGLLLLLLVLIRIGVRLRRGAPPLPPGLPGWQKAGALASHALLYVLMLAMPLIGWSMLSAAGYPLTLFGVLRVPPILSPDPALYATLRAAHGWLAYLLFAVVLLHLGAALFHALIRRDGVFRSMAP